MTARQRGASLIEVLVALLVMSIGLLGAAAIQLNALKFTDSSALRTKASFIAYDMMDRIRANPDGAYALASLDAAPGSGSLNAPATQDLYDFKANITATLPDGTGVIAKTGYVYTITVGWNDARAATAVNSSNASSTETATQSFVLTSRVAMDAVTQ
ncbi:type IV pilus modification protein PilV [Pseudomonas typographi]|uniref:Type IV pilus modification protein PilV n=1 Tax=Pseudomonas typographi TaxID=2715964 RepID=A0ABR7YXN5_9PSED|nr:type IV pilus modification protein PilV [Pseudomonas typographi]MBD1551062.1 type IV pilus modification protein PilV [Pseudomonas typographi]MBD1587975.1 type IV pilus modification protein PilV [Pseudomonas typographi]MBD1597964.1 type IV pilus modification protein PilV [Pseudomonas typographi]